MPRVKESNQCKIPKMQDFLKGEPLPFKFSYVTLLYGKCEKDYDEVILDTGDILRSRI